ncbi:MAG: ABC transporter ATP-binding protein [Bacillota bacterium]
MSSEFDLDLTEEAEQRPFNMAYFLRILRYTRPYVKEVVKVAALMLFAVISNIVDPLIFRYAIDEGIAKKNLRLLSVLAVVMVVRLVAVKYAARAQTRGTHKIGQSILYDLRQNLFNRVQGLPFSFFDHRPVGKVISRITNDVNHIQVLASTVVLNVVSQLVSLIGIIAIVLYLNWRMALLSFTTLPFLVWVLTKVRWSLEKAWGDTRKAVAEINAHLNETVQGLQVIQAFGREDANNEKFAKGNRKYFKAHMRAIMIDQAFWPLTDFIGAMGTALVIWYGAREFMAGRMSYGLIVAFVDYLGKFWRPINTFSRVWSQVLSAMASAERVFGIIDLQTEQEESMAMARKAAGAEATATTRDAAATSSDQAIQPAIQLEALPRITGEVRFEDVSFGYRADIPVLHGVNLHVKPGETIALVGPTGAGKTTIINLLARFYIATAGKVTVDGYDLATVDLPTYRSQLGMVLQDTFIFSGTIMENLKFGKLDATQEEVEKAVEAACAKGFIEELPGKFDAEVKERGTNLSSGQRQLLAFARALLADPRILILDEATSSIDPETERLIQQAMKTLLKGRTSFIIAHRLSTVRAADRILVIDDGRIVEEGTHDQLVDTGGHYAQLYEAQFKRQERHLNHIVQHG